jgi:rare lipoprotein A
VLVGCTLAAASLYVAAAVAAEPESTNRTDSASLLQGWGKRIESSSSQATAKHVGVWAVEGPTRLRMRSARQHEVSTGGPGRLALGPIEAVTLVAKGKAHEVVTDAATVGELLSAMRIEPDGNDRVDPPPSTPLSFATRVIFTEVGIHTMNTIESVPAAVASVITGRLPAGATQTLVPARPARILRTYRVRYVNGRAVGRQLVFSRVIQASRPGRELVGATHSSMVGEASWYYVNDRLNAASPWLPFGTRVTVTNLATGATVTVVINDRGPFGGRLIDLSEYAFSQIAPLGQGVCTVRISW